MSTRFHTSEQIISRRRTVVPLTAAALACLAGTPAGLAQFGDPGDGMRDPMADTSSPLEDGVTVTEDMLVDLHVNDEDLATVLQMLSIQSQKNIVTSQNVSATVTANLYSVTFEQALDAILHVNGYGYIVDGNFIYVYTQEELLQIQEAMRQMETRVFNLNYLNATDAADFCTPLLSEKGQIKAAAREDEFDIPDNAPAGGQDYALGAMIVVTDYEENLDAIAALVGQIDTRPSQVLVEATILQTELKEGNAFGFDLSIVGSLDLDSFAGIGGPMEAVNGLIDGQGKTVDGTAVRVPNDEGGGAITSNPGNVRDGAATFKAGIVSGDISAFLRALDEVTDTTILSRPKVVTLNRQPARVLVGRKVGYLSTTATETATTQTVEFLDTGTQLYIRPFVSNEGLIRMELKPQVSEAVIRNAIDATGAAVTIPDEVTNELTANVMIRDGQTVVLGGLFREATQAQRRQVPVLGDVPIIGEVFRGHDNSAERSEIIFMITPSVVNDDILLEQGQRGLAYVERVRTGAREGLLFFSRERITGQLNVEAERLAAEGKKDKALWKLQRSLQMNPVQPEAVAMRDALMSDPKVWPNRSMLDDVMSGEVDAKLKAWGVRAGVDHNNYYNGFNEGSPFRMWNAPNSGLTTQGTDYPYFQGGDTYGQPVSGAPFNETQNDQANAGTNPTATPGAFQQQPINPWNAAFNQNNTVSDREPGTTWAQRLSFRSAWSAFRGFLTTTDDTSGSVAQTPTETFEDK